MTNRAKGRKLVASLSAALALAAPSLATAHPHVFAEASLEVVVDEDGAVRSLGHVWRFDDLFSATVLFEFDENRDLLLDEKELEEVAAVVHESLSEFDYFQLVTRNGKDVAMEPPPRLFAAFQDQQLTIMFESSPAEPLMLSGRVSFGIYDPTFYTAIDFYEDDMMMVKGLPPHCERSVVRPDPDEAIEQNQQTLTEAFFQDPIDYSQIFATRLELNCAGRS